MLKLCLFIIVFLQLSAHDIFQETLKYIEDHSFPELEIISYDGSNNISESKAAPSVYIVNKTSFKATQELVLAGYKPLVLDMANKTSPGGSVWQGAKMQEETLCRQSNLYTGLIQAQYPLLELGGVLIKNVTFFRNDAYRFLENTFQADVFASAAYDCNKRHLSGYDQPGDNADYEKGTQSKMRAYFRAALKNGNDALVLGAFGCGAFKNEPSLIGKWYQKVLSEQEFQDTFKLIIFAIPHGPNATAFQNVFPVNPAMIFDIANTPIEEHRLVCFYKSGPTEFLGNFYLCQNGVTLWDHTFRCSESAFQWKKYELANIQDPKMDEFFYADGVQAFRLNRYFEKKYPDHFANDWKEGVRDEVMWEILQAKFEQNPEIKQLLHETKGAYLLEHNQAPRDTYWSDNQDGSGKNLLGKMLMALRDDLPKPPIDDSTDADLILYFANFANQPASLNYPIY